MLNRKDSKRRSSRGEPLSLKITAVVLAVVLVIIMMFSEIYDRKREAEITAMVEQRKIELLAEKQAMEEKKNNDSFYQKLVDGFDVNVLIVGDSIGVGINETSWAGLLASYLQTTYKCKVNLTNVSMGGNSSYAGYARTLMLDDGVDYDLAVICYGQNDREQDFSLYYESIIRALRSKFSKCSVISILESSQRTYTNKMTTIQKICEHYNIPVADTIAAFANSGKEYSELCSDNVHPNDEGKVIYFETVKNIVDKCASEYASYNPTEVAPINTDVTKFDTFKFYAADEFEKVDEVTYTIKTSISGIMGIDYTYESGENQTNIYVDGNLFVAPKVTFNYDFSQRHILIVSDNCTVNGEIKIVFANAEQAKGFGGIMFSNISE